MQKKLLDDLVCPTCKNSSFQLFIDEENKIEIREGYIQCNDCQTKIKISKGILDTLVHPSSIVKLVQEGTLKYDLCPKGLPFKVEDAMKHKESILSLPKGDGSDFFKNKTMFKTISNFSQGFCNSLSVMKLTGKEKLLDLGTSFCWTTNKFAELGCQCVALDVTHHLSVSDVFIYENKTYFERVKADMGELPFKKDSFDVIITIESLHHAPNLEKTLKEISRVLKPNGKVYFIEEPLRSVFDQKGFGSQLSAELNLNEHWYTAREYHSAAKQAGLKLKFKSNLNPTISPELKSWKKIVKTFLNQSAWLTKTRSVPIPLLMLFPMGVIMIAHK
jgi:ubiquinone/menaquinone biosynthesis C-methylase UbiE/uncharacterized protein YbaR (Trm112 family)